MTYKRSVYRNDFDQRITFLLKKAMRAQRLGAGDSDIRDLVFQCVIFLTCAAMEVYLKLLIEGWAQNLRALKLGTKSPIAARAYFAIKQLEGPFAKYQSEPDERALLKAIQSRPDIWNLMIGIDDLPAIFSGSMLHDKCAYPSKRNINKLFSRVGISDAIGTLNGILSRDVGLLIDAFQDIRTALAHSAPPAITITDVEARLADSKALIGAVDRMFYSHVMRHGGVACW
jgi:hypothetical protein